MKRMSSTTSARTVAAVLAVDGLLHVYWATGQTWPARDTGRLSQLVLNTQVPFTPQGLIPLAGLLGGSAALLLVRAGRLPGLGRRLPAALPRWAAHAVTGGLLLRGMVGLVWVTGLGADPRDTFYWLNLLLYTPLCLALAAVARMVATAPEPARGPALPAGSAPAR